MPKYEKIYEDDNFEVKHRDTQDGTTTIIDNNRDDWSEDYTSIHEGDCRNTVVDTHYDDGSRTVTVFDEDGELINQFHEDADGNTEDAMPDIKVNLNDDD